MADEINSYLAHYDIRSKPSTHLVEREFQEKEEPLKIEKLRDGKVVAVAVYNLK